MNDNIEIMDESNSSVCQQPLKRQPLKRINDDWRNIPSTSNDNEHSYSFNKKSKIIAKENDLPFEDLPKLIEIIEKSLPIEDTNKYQLTLRKIKWDEIAFNNFSPEQCKIAWNKIQNQLRTHRVFSELIIDAKEWLKKPWLSFNKPNQPAHPDFPKKPLNGYILFFKDNYPVIQAENPGITFPEMARLIGQHYQNLSPHIRETYKRIAEYMKELYKQQVAEFYRNHPEFDEKQYETNKTRKPASAFQLYYREQLKSVKNPNLKMFRKACKDVWESLNVEHKRKFTEMALKQENEYRNKIHADNDQKPPHNVLVYFKQLQLKSNKFKGVKNANKIISEKWKALPKSEKEKYRSDLCKLKSKYFNPSKAQPDVDVENDFDMFSWNLTVMNQILPKCWMEMPVLEKSIFINSLETLKTWYENKYEKKKENNNNSSDSNNNQ